MLAKELASLKKEYAASRKDLSKTQKQYDKETQHGVIAEIQKMWLENIAKGLEQ